MDKSQDILKFQESTVIQIAWLFIFRYHARNDLNDMRKSNQRGLFLWVKISSSFFSRTVRNTTRTPNS